MRKYTEQQKREIKAIRYAEATCKSIEKIIHKKHKTDTDKELLMEVYEDQFEGDYGEYEVGELL